MRFLHHLFRRTRDGHSLEELFELIANRETRPKVLQALRKQNQREPLQGGYRELLDILEEEDGINKGLNVLDELALGKQALAESIVSRLDLAPVLAAREVNRDERMMLNLWGITLCVMRAVPNVSDEEKVAFLDRYHEYIHLASCPEGIEASGWARFINRISTLSRTRYQEYDNAFSEMLQNQKANSGDPNLHLVPGIALSCAITKNLFGLESDMLAIPIQLLVMNQLIAFAKTFGSPEDWATTRNFVEQACRLHKADAKDS